MVLNVKFAHDCKSCVGEREAGVRSLKARTAQSKNLLNDQAGGYSPQALEHKTFDIGRFARRGNLTKDNNAKEILTVAKLTHVERKVEYPAVLLFCVRSVSCEG